jgi:hypothetical protein
MGWVYERLKAGKFDGFQLHGVLCREKRGSNKGVIIKAKVGR